MNRLVWIGNQDSIGTIDRIGQVDVSTLDLVLFRQVLSSASKHTPFRFRAASKPEQGDEGSDDDTADDRARGNTSHCPFGHSAPVSTSLSNLGMVFTYPPELLGVTVVMAVTVFIPFPPPVLVGVPPPVCVPVGEGAAGVEDGDRSFRQLESDDEPMV